MENENGKSRRSFWTTLPGILTACAALVTAVGGLIVGLDKVGLIGPSSPEEVISVPPPSEPPPVEPPPRTSKVTFLPIVEGMGTLQGKSGSLIEGSATPFSPPELGDGQDGKEVRGFISFDLSHIPKAAEITEATLHVVQGGMSGDLNKDYFGTVLIESLDIGEVLDGTDFGKSGVLVRQISLSSLQSEPHDVTEEIRRAQLLGYETITLRLRFAVAHDNDDESDCWALRYSQGQTRLEVTVATEQ